MADEIQQNRPGSQYTIELPGGESKMHQEETEKMKGMFDNLRSDKYPLGTYNYIGKRIPRRLDGVAKAGGSAEYTMDVQLPGMLHMRFLTSLYPHAAIGQMDTRRAENLPGVRYVLRYDDPELPEAIDLAGHADHFLLVIHMHIRRCDMRLC